jgi:hypothetical protein
VFCALPKGVSHQIAVLRPTLHREKAEYMIVSTNFYYIQIFFEHQYILYKKGMGVWIL